MKNEHSADDAALGFLYQGQYALLALWRETDDDAVLHLETLDDVVLVSKGSTLLEQLKHSLKTKPPAISIASVPLWKTLKAWIDVLPKVDLAHTSFHLVTVAGIAADSPLSSLLEESADREDLLVALNTEAQRVVYERAEAATKGSHLLPHAERASACAAFLSLPEEIKAALLARTRIKSSQPNISAIENLLAESLTTVVRERRAQVAKQLFEWWNKQVLELLIKNEKQEYLDLN